MVMDIHEGIGSEPKKMLPEPTAKGPGWPGGRLASEASRPPGHLGPFAVGFQCSMHRYGAFVAYFGRREVFSIEFLLFFSVL